MLRTIESIKSFNINETLFNSYNISENGSWFHEFIALSDKLMLKSLSPWWESSFVR